MAVWLAYKNVWPVTFEPARGGQHFKFVYGEDLPASLIAEYFQPDNSVRRTLGMHGRVRHQMHEAQLHGDGLVPFEVPML